MNGQADKKTILVVDDAAENIDLMVGLLKGRFIVKAARNGNVALKIANSPKPPDLILLDILMPEMDGFQVCQILRSEEKTMNIPVIFVSGEIGSEEREKAKQFNAGTLTKPIEPQKLMEMIDTLFGFG